MLRKRFLFITALGRRKFTGLREFVKSQRINHLIEEGSIWMSCTKQVREYQDEWEELIAL